MFDQLERAVSALRETVAALDPDRLSGADAARLVGVFTEAERLGAAGRTLAARRVDDSNVWRRRGHRSAAHYLASATGTSVGGAVSTLETARRLQELPATDQAFRAGRLSAPQAQEIAAAAAGDPDAEGRLLESAATEGLAGLRDRCRRVKAAACPDESARQRAIHAGPYLRHRTDTEGAFRMEVRDTVDVGAEVLATLEPFLVRIFGEARRAGRRERYEAYAADALVAMARHANRSHKADGSGPRATVHVRVDHSALVRGHTEGGETCEIPGVGPIPVATARALADDAIVYGLLTKGVDVIRVAHLGRRPTAAQRRALEARDPECVVPGCHVRDHPEIDRHRLDAHPPHVPRRPRPLVPVASPLEDPLRLPARGSPRRQALGPPRRATRSRAAAGQRRRRSDARPGRDRSPRRPAPGVRVGARPLTSRRRTANPTALYRQTDFRRRV